jgi:hypothetical protein
MRPFGEFAPDIHDLNTDSLDIARNVYPGTNSYLPAPSLVTHSTDAPPLPLPCKGLWYVQTLAGGWDTYAATAEKLYKYDAGTQAFVDVSRLVGGAYALPVDDFWSGVQYGPRLVLTNLGNEPQFIDINTGTEFADLPNAPIAKLVSVMDDHLVFAHLLTNPRSIAWSAINDSEDYTTGTSGTQEFSDAGFVTAFLPNAHILMLERGLRGIVSTGDKYAFTFPPMSSEKGTVSPWSVIEFGGLAYWLSADGFYAGTSEQQQNISERRIQKQFFDTMNYNAITRIYATIDPHASRIFWTYAVGDADWNDRVLVYDWGLNRWSYLELDTYILARAATASLSLDAFTWPSMDDPGLPSLDSFLYRAGAPVLSGVGTDLKLSMLEGPTLPATLQTCSYQFDAARRVRMRALLSFIEGSDAEHVTVKVSKRKRYGEDWATSGAIPQQPSGYYRMNADGMFHRFQFDIPAGAVWSHAHGWEPNFIASTER